MMKLARLTSKLAGAIVLIIPCAVAVLAQDVVPARKEPFHVPIVENEFVRVLNVVIPAGKTTLFHEHAFDFLSVFIEGSNMKNETPDGAPAFVNTSTAGFVRYNGYAKKPFVHRVTNLGDNRFWVVGTEILISEPGKFQVSNREVPGYKLELDNERLRAWRLVLEPNGSAPTITQSAPGLRISLSDGKIVEQVAGRDQEISLKRGDFVWQPAGATRSLRNTGNAPVELIEYELK